MKRIFDFLGTEKRLKYLQVIGNTVKYSHISDSKEKLKMEKTGIRTQITPFDYINRYGYLRTYYHVANTGSVPRSKKIPDFSQACEYAKWLHETLKTEKIEYIKPE